MSKSDRLEPSEVGFVILCPHRNLGGFRTTARSVAGSFPGQPLVGVLGADATDGEVQEFGRDAPTVRAGRTVTSLMNAGVGGLPKAEWVCFLDAGTVARPGMFRQHRRFGPKDIMYRVVGRRHDFTDAGIDGMVVNRGTFLDVGPLSEGEDSMELVKLFWGLDAVERGCRLVGIVGTRL